MSTPFVFGIVEKSMRLMVDGGDIRVAFSKDLPREPLSLVCVSEKGKPLMHLSLSTRTAPKLSCLGACNRFASTGKSR